MQLHLSIGVNMMLPVVVHSAAHESHHWNGDANDVVLSCTTFHVNPQGRRGLL